MNLKAKLSFHRWNIGFIEKPANEIVSTDKTAVKWLKHNYYDRFFADPFILDHNENIIEVLVEEYPFFSRKGIISLLTIDRMTFELKDKRTIIDQPYHQSYPFILRLKDKTYIIPEASESGALWYYELRDGDALDRQVLINEPLLDSTIIKKGDKWWLFATKRGDNSNKDLYIYKSENPLNGYSPLRNTPVKSDLSSSRPAGYPIEINGQLYRVTQDCSRTYGGGINLTEIKEMSEDNFCERICHPVITDLGEFNEGFHTINEFNGLTVVDGIKSEFRPLKKILMTLKSHIRN